MFPAVETIISGPTAVYLLCAPWRMGGFLFEDLFLKEHARIFCEIPQFAIWMAHLASQVRPRFPLLPESFPPQVFFWQSQIAADLIPPPEPIALAILEFPYNYDKPIP